MLQALTPAYAEIFATSSVEGSGRGGFDRYNIVNEDDLRRASQRVKAYHFEREKQEAEKAGQDLGKVNSEHSETIH